MKYILVFLLANFVGHVHARRIADVDIPLHKVEQASFVIEDADEIAIAKYNADEASSEMNSPGRNVENTVSTTFPWLMLISLLGLVLFKVIERSVDSLKQTMADYHETVSIKLGAKPMA